MNWPPNPFPFGAPVPNDALFINREGELGRLRSSVQDFQTTVVLVEGARRLGKTSILQRFRRDIEGDATPIDLDIQDLSIAHGPSVADEVAARKVLLTLGEKLLRRTGVSESLGEIQTAEQFQTVFLLPALTTSQSRRIVVLLDEFDILEDAYPAATEEVLAAFRVNFNPPPLLVCCCGRPMGAPKTDRLAFLLKTPPSIPLKPFNDVTTKSAPDLAGVYKFTPNARTLFWDVTQGHPLWINAINHYIYSERSRIEDVSEVEAEEVLLSLAPACEWFKHAIWNIWRQLGPMQSLLCRAVADITWDLQHERFLGAATLSQIETELQPFFSIITTDQLRRAAAALIDNYILKPAGEGYSLYSPFLGYWLRQQDRTELRLAGDPQVARRLTQAREHLTQQDLASALVAVDDAISLDPTNTDALLIAADLAEQKGDLDVAILRLEQVSRSQPQTAKLRLSEVLVRRIELASKRGDSPDPWYYKLNELAPEEAAAGTVVRSILDYHLGRWEQSIRRGEGEAAHSVFEELANKDLPNWRGIAAERYADLVNSLLHVEEGLARCVPAIRHEFIILTEKEIEPIYPEQPDFERELLSKFEGDPLTQERIRQHFEQYADRYPWWTSTLSAIEKSLNHANAGSREWVPLDLIEKIMFRAPDFHRRKLMEEVSALLPRRLSAILSSDLSEGASAVRLLYEACLSSPDNIHSTLQEALEDHLVQVTEAGDEEVVKFFRHGARIYLLWVDVLTPSSKQCSNILEQIDLLMDRMKSPQGTVPAESGKWELFIRGGEGLAEWQDLLRHRALKSEQAKLLLQSICPPEAVEHAIRAASLTQPRKWGNVVKSHLDASYQNVRPLDIGIPGIPTEMVKFYRAYWNREEVNLKVYRLSAHAPSKEFLEHLWEKEKRALVNLSTRLSGRSLTRFKFSERISVGEDGEYLVIVTEPAGPTTLREQLKNFGQGGILNRDRQGLWQAIHSLVESVSALHRAHYLHRSIRPENIFVQELNGKPHFKLGNFEWSLYLHSLADEFPKDDRWVDRYTAPEVLAARFNNRKPDVGEGFSSEVYSLGLVLFELLIRRLSATELGRFYTSGDYDLETHREWLHGLRKEVRDRMNGHDQKDERLLLLETLEPSVALRRSDLDDLVRLTASFAWDSKEIETLLDTHKPYLATTLARGNATSIEHFLEPLVRPGELGSTEIQIGQLISRELSGARVYRNANRDHPLLIEGRRILFTATPFIHRSGRKGHEQISNPEIPFLTVANPTLDRREGAPIARLPSDLPVVDIFIAHQDLSRINREIVRKGQAWGRLFALATAGADRLPDESREFYTILQITAEVEEKLWRQHVASYKLDSKSQESGQLVIVIKRAESASREFLPVDRMVAQQVTRGEHFFELSSNDSPLAALQPNQVWKLERVDTAQGTVQLSRENGDWPVAEGYVRPQSLSGNRAIRQRRTETLFNLRDDEYLLKAITDVSTIQEKLPARELQFFDTALDHDKRRIVRNILTTPPLYLVQGPPGTGKTTLAAEVIRQELELNPSARILVTSQSHEPLNNLLMRVHRAFKDVDQTRRPAAVRLLSSALLQSRRWSKETRQVMMEFQPAEVAKRHIDLARNWQPSGDSGIDAGLVSKWRAWLETHSKNLPSELERKIVASANLVYATANDRSISAVPEHREFDLLIFEEAAKAYPLEVLGPMRLARRWLLIGDHEQLSAFNIEEFRSEAAAATRRLYEMAGGSTSRNQRHTRVLGLVSDSNYRATEIADFFEYLFTKGIGQDGEGHFADRLRLQWRMHPQISHLVREVYYDFLQDGDISALKQKHAHRISYPDEFRRSSIIWIDVPLTIGKPSRGLTDKELTAEAPFSGGGYRNPFEARVLHNVMRAIQVSGRGGLAGNIAFLSPYKAQVDLINKFFKSWDGRRNPQTGDLRQKAYTVDSFQGRQAEVVAVSLVRNNSATGGFDAYGFLEGAVGKSRAAVMFSRAERLLIIIGCSEHFIKQSGFHIGRVFEFVQQNGLVIDAKYFLEERDYQDLRKHKDIHERRSVGRSLPPL